MNHTRLFPLIIAIGLLANNAFGDASRSLKEMVGFTIVGSGSVSKVLSDDMSSDKFVILDNGLSFKVQFMFLRPLPLSDVIIFSKPLPAEIVAKFPSAPKALLFQYKLLIDGEAYDASPKAP